MELFNVNELLGEGHYWRVSKQIARKSSLDAAVMLTDLLDKRDYFMGIGQMLDLGDWFYNTVENIELDTTLSAHKQRAAVKELVGLGLIDVEYRGMPKKRYYRLYDLKILQSLKNLTTSGEKIERQVVKKFDINNNKEIRGTNVPVDTKENLDLKDLKEKKEIKKPGEKFYGDALKDAREELSGKKLKSVEDIYEFILGSSQLIKLRCDFGYKELKGVCKRNGVGLSVVYEVLMSMENFKGLTKKYASLHLTLNNWIKIRKERGSIVERSGGPIELGGGVPS